jgi:hypothetical protein
MSRMRDFEIRAALRVELQRIHCDEPTTSIIDELSLCQGGARVDVAVVNGSLSGYEIKSDRDRLTRLPRQLAVYDICFDTMIMVVGSRHVKACRKTIPKTWGIWEAMAVADRIEFKVRRQPKINRQIKPQSVVQLLWKNEVLESLRQVGVLTNPKLGRRELWGCLVQSVDPRQLFQMVRDHIRARGDWRSGPTPFRGGGLSRSASTSRRYRENRGWLLSAVSQCRPG